MEITAQTHIEPAFVGLILSVLIISVSSAFFLRVVPIKFDPLQKVIVGYFTACFAGMTVLYSFLAVASYFGHLVVLELLSYVMYLGCVYAIRQGLLVRYHNTISHLHQQSVFWWHVVIFVVVQVSVFVLYVDNFYYRIAFLILNLIGVALTLKPYLYIDKSNPTKAERIAFYILLGIGLALAAMFVLVLLSQFNTLYFAALLAFKLLNLHIAALGLVTLILSDDIDIYYHSSITDSLTGLYNRRYFMEQTAILLLEQVGKQKNSVLITCDIDFFKQINDQHGHEVGDQAIIAFANMLRASVPEKSIAARIGGEEFVVFIPNMVIQQAEKLAENLRLKTHAITLTNSHGEAVNYTASFGVTVCNDEPSIENYMRTADEALYFAKKVGRNRVVFYDDLMDK